MSEWTAKEEYPSLKGAKAISVDAETKDPQLKELGPSTFRGGGHVCGFSLATEDGFVTYVPIKHPEGNVKDPEQAIRWAKDQLETDIPKVGANLGYDIEVFQKHLGIKIGGPKLDIQIAGPLIDENYHSYSLDALSQRWLGKTKDEALLYQAGVELLGFTGKGKTDEEKRKSVIGQVKGEIWRLPAKYVGPYGEADALLPFEIFRKQEKQMEKDGLRPIFELETKLLDVLVAMRFKGIPVDVKKAEETAAKLKVMAAEAQDKVNRRAGSSVDIWSGEVIQKVCDKLGLFFPHTDTLTKEGKKLVGQLQDLSGLKFSKSSIATVREETLAKYGGAMPEDVAKLLSYISETANPSFEAKWLATQEHPFFTSLLEARQLDRCGAVFVRDKILNMQVNGRLYPQFLQVKRDEGGTVSGRLSSKNPNAQQFPSRNELLAEMTRSLLVAEPGCKWVCNDYVSQEPRLTLHYSCLLKLSRAEEAKQKFIDDPLLKEHKLIAAWTGLPYRDAKIVNLGKSYGMGIKKYAKTYNKTLAEAREIYYIYDQNLPYKKELSQYCERVVKNRGFLKTLLGRHCNFNLWGPPNWKEGVVPKRIDEAIKEFGTPIIRYFVYKAVNRLIQGSGADLLKKAMVDCAEAGYVPCVTVHDELDHSDIETEKQAKEIKEIMENAVKLELPLVAETEIGASWGTTEVVKCC